MRFFTGQEKKIVCHQEFKICFEIMCCPPKIKLHSALLFYSFVHNSSIKELKNMKLSEHVYYELIN